MDRRTFLSTLGAGAAAWAARGAVAQAPRRPNLLLIFVDDLGYGDLGCYGGELVPTPNLDALAAGGVRCTDGYVTSPICAPSRAGLLAGAYQQRFGIEINEDQYARVRDYHRWGEQRLLPEVLRAAGYVTGHVGKWNMQRDAHEVFDEAQAVMDWKGDYFPAADGTYAGVDGVPVESEPHGWGPEGDGEYLTDRLSRLAGEFIGRHRDAPWFLYLAYNAVHSPWQGERELAQRVAHIPEPLRLYAAMVLSLDQGVGQVLEQLRATGQERDTLVAFISDNGPAMGRSSMSGWRPEWPDPTLMGSVAGLAGHKANLLEGGIRVPYLLRWPGRLSAGETYTRPVSTMDVLPTFAAAASAPVPDGNVCDGVDLLPHLTGAAAGPPHERLFWSLGQQMAAREGDWKLFKWPKQPEPALFNLAEDRAETTNVAGQHPEVYQRLLAAWQAWHASLPPTATAAWRAAR